MPDSLLPPGWGFAPFDERDLDAVLSGKTSDVPVALRPVADVLASLRAGPVPTELYGEANAMAEFRALGLGQGGPGRPAPTVQLEARPAGSRARPGRQPARHRVRPARRHPLRRAILRPAVLSAVAAAAVIVVAVLVTGNFVGSLRGIAHMASTSAGASVSKSPPGRSPAPRAEASSAAREPTASASTTPAQSVSNSCRAYFSYDKHPEGLSYWATRSSLWDQLTKLVGTHNWMQVYRDCAPYMQGIFPDVPAEGDGQLPLAPVHPGRGDQNNGDQGRQADAPANSWNDSGSGTVSRSQASNGQASNGQASSGQGDPSGSGSNP